MPDIVVQIAGAELVQPYVDASKKWADAAAASAGDAKAQVGSIPKIKQEPNNSRMNGGVGHWSGQAPAIVATGDAAFEAAGAIFEAQIAPGADAYWLCQFGTTPILPGEHVVASVFVRRVAGQPWPSGVHLRVVLGGVPSVELVDYDTADDTHRRYHGVIVNTSADPIADSIIQLGNTGTATLAACLFAHGRSMAPVDDVDWRDLDPFDTETQNDAIAGLRTDVDALAQGGAVARPALVVAGCGDSHLMGMFLNAAASDGSAVTLGLQFPLGPLDHTWNGTGVDPLARLDSAINNVDGSTDRDWSAVTPGQAGWLSLLPAVLRAGYPNLGDITTANLGVGGSSAYTWAGEQAMTFVKAVAQPIEGDTEVIDQQVYTFRATPAAAYDVAIGSGAVASLANLVAAINGEGAGFFAGTPAHPTCWAHLFGTGPFARVRALETGTAGNGITISASSTARITPVDDTLAPVASRKLTGGSATSAVYQNAKAKLAGGSGLVPPAFVLSLGTNEAIRPGYRGRKMQAELTKLFAAIHADYPGAQILIHRPPVIGTGAAATAALTGNVLPAIDAVVAANPSFAASVDVYALGAGVGRCAILNGTDGIHLTPYGYSLVAQLFARGMAKRLGL